ncbi:MAG: GNAT family N-acetyltransferase [Phycisphaeraceae bacterium]|nr:GNAT family N-acetyltransferase [Phycisphaeraceae bacterium]
MTVCDADNELDTDGFDLRVERVGPAQQQSALALLAGGGRGRTRQTRRFLRDEGINLDHFWIVRHEGRPLLTLLVAVRPGRSGLLIHSPLDRRPVMMVGLTRAARAAADSFDSQQVLMLQALLDLDRSSASRALARAGFEDLAVLSCLRLRVGGAGSDTADQRGDWCSWSEANRPLFVAAIEASYEQTRDCSGLVGLRPTDDVLAGHMASGDGMEPDLWRVCLIDGQPAGVVLMNPIRQRRSMGLVYLGVASRWRGQGVGSDLLAWAQAETSRRGFSHLELSVDEVNEPAIRLYRRAGFQRAARKRVMICRLKSRD